ncbi:MAG: hypothetical protein ABJE95_12875 [Byssovorax sp.]
MIRIALVALVALAPAAAVAQPAAPPDAVTLGHEALDLYGRGDWEGAFQRFSRADSAAHSPVFALYMARCRGNQGALLAARDLFAALANESLPPSAPEAWQKARVDAATELTAIEARIPSVIIAVSGAPIEGAAVTVDDAAVAASALGKPIRLDPGAHTVAAKARGRAPITESIRLAEGPEPRRITLVIPAETPPLVASTPPAVRVDRPPPIAPIAPTRGSLVPGIVALGAGAAGLGLGLISGVIARGKADDVKGRCVGVHCLPGDADEGHAAQTLATVSTVGFVVGGAAAAAGITLILVRPGGSSPGSTSSTDARAALSPTAGGLVLTGRF